MRAYIGSEVHSLVGACEALCAAAPTPDQDGWSIEHDDAAVQQMRVAWRRARVSYERVEGAIAVLFPQTDQDVDGRYEHVVELRADAEPFDDQGFIGMHAIERILWSDSHSEPVLAFERALPAYAPARTPSSLDEARAFSESLCGRLVRDVRAMETELGPIALDPATAWRGILGSVEEQAEKVLLGTTGQSESRYALHTLADMQANLEGGRAIVAAFAPLLATLPEGSARRAAIEARFDALEAVYREAGQDALPEVPRGFDPDAPSEEHLATPYGVLFAALAEETDPRGEGLAALLRETAGALDIPTLSR